MAAMAADRQNEGNLASDWPYFVRDLCTSLRMHARVGRCCIDGDDVGVVADADADADFDAAMVAADIGQPRVVGLRLEFVCRK